MKSDIGEWWNWNYNNAELIGFFVVVQWGCSINSAIAARQFDWNQTLVNDGARNWMKKKIFLKENAFLKLKWLQYGIN